MQLSGCKYNAVQTLLALVVATTTIGLVGCGSGAKTGEVTGTVTLDGNPVPGLEVNFVPIDISLGTTATGYTQASGQYELFLPGKKTKTPVGDYTVRIVAAEVDEPGGSPIRIPARYNVQSQLKATVAPGAQTHDFELTSR
jgi:hypothetical protein